MPPIIYNINNATFKENMAAFDFDWTMVNPKNGKTFPSNIDDWEWLYSTVPDKIKEYHQQGYMIVIFTNQSKPWKYQQIQLVAKLLEIPLFVVIATQRTEYKPNLILLETLLKEVEEGEEIEEKQINKQKSFFVGDALGRKSDFSDCDKVFAENIGIPYYSPESIFDNLQKVFELPKIPLSDNPEIIIMMGYPGSGKTTIAKEICKDERYVHIASDIYKTLPKMKKAALEHIQQKKSIVFDATHSSIKKRKEIIDLAKQYNYTIKCIHVATSKDISYKRNKSRNDKNQVPLVAYSVYKKHFEEPTHGEGFTLITI